MTCRSFSPPVGPPRSDLPLPDAFWLDLPQAWADEIVRSFNRCLPPVGEGP